MSTLSYAKHERLSLKNHASFNEKWLQDRIADDPAVLGLGELVVLDRERAQERAGRLDLLLSDPDQTKRYEVELMLGATDESRIIRCIEYWDIERRRYPGYDHCAVLVAEDITSRFLNVISLLSGTIPLVVIQLNALQVGDNILLDFVRVLDQRQLRRDDTNDLPVQAVDRAYWVQKSNTAVLDLADQVLAIVNEKAQPKLSLNYNKYYIGLTDGSRARNFLVFRPRKGHLRIGARQAWTEARARQFEDAGLEAEQKDDELVFNLSTAALKKHRDLVAAFIHELLAAGV